MEALNLHSGRPLELRTNGKKNIPQIFPTRFLSGMKIRSVSEQMYVSTRMKANMCRLMYDWESVFLRILIGISEKHHIALSIRSLQVVLRGFTNVRITYSTKFPKRNTNEVDVNASKFDNGGEK